LSEKRSQRCETCFFWERDYDGAVAGACRRRPPVVVIITKDDGDHDVTAWPDTREKDWCGEWQYAGAHTTTLKPTRVVKEGE
jgi:hypothetical protein